MWKASNSYGVTLHAKSLLTLKSTTEGKITDQTCSFLHVISHFHGLAGSQKVENTYAVYFQVGTYQFYVFSVL